VRGSRLGEGKLHGAAGSPAQIMGNTAAMDRRLVIVALACWPLPPLFAQGAEPRPRHKISAAQLYDALSRRFPLRFRLGRMLELEVSAPRLLLLPARNKIGAGLSAYASGAQFQQGEPGELDLVFAVRYEASDQTVRGHTPEVVDLRWRGLPPEGREVVQGLVAAMARDVGEVVLHKFSARELALPDTMGFEPQELQVLDDGVLILFGPKARR
jgi:hypothetical protein